eukprot:scaffold74061_cov49-Phaeocystis_antarctica.AAC.1
MHRRLLAQADAVPGQQRLPPLLLLVRVHLQIASEFGRDIFFGWCSSFALAARPLVPHQNAQVWRQLFGPVILAGSTSSAGVSPSGLGDMAASASGSS